MRQTVPGGLLLAAATALLILLADPLNLEVTPVALLGAALGAVLGLVGDRSILDRLAAFAVGFVVVWASYGARAQFLPDSDAGRAVAAAAVILLLVLAVWLSADRLRLWAMLLGAAAMIGAYEEIFIDSPPQFLEQSPEAATKVILAVALGLLATTLLGPWLEGEQAGGRHRSGDSETGDVDEDDVSLDTILHHDDQEIRA